jgi:peptide/nickel transport system ATP-binding protein
MNPAADHAPGFANGRPAPPASPYLLEVEDLHVHFVTSRGVVRAVEGISYRVRSGEVVALVGESGCGKSVSALAVMRLLAKPAGRIVKGRVLFQGRDLLELTDDDMRELRGRDIAMIFQEPMTSLNPVLTIGFQIMESLIVHFGWVEARARARTLELMKLVGIPDGERRLDQYPHQFSGGMRQRAMIAIALACNPKLIIADEPTTALDVTIQAQILKLMKDLSRELGIALVIITHNLGVVARYADRVNVMYAARIAERAPADKLFATPRHPYTQGLMRSVPRLDRSRTARLETIEGLPPNLLDPPAGCRFAERCFAATDDCRTRVPPLEEIGADHYAACWRVRAIATSEAADTIPASAKATAATATETPVIEVRDLAKHFAVKAKGLTGASAVVRAVAGVSFEVPAGRTLGLVGESGCGKTTVGRLILNLETPTAGRVLFGGRDNAEAGAEGIRAMRRRVQAVFQDPYSSLNPRMTVGQIIAEPLRVHGLVNSRRAARERVANLLASVGLFPYMAERYPHELSGGQRQRVGVARALGMNPSFIVCDEPVSALDVSIQAQIINLLEDLQANFGIAYLFIAHDLAVVRHIAHRVAVMYLGRVMEIADRDALYDSPAHPYTQALLAAAPTPDPEAERRRPHALLAGEVPSPLNPPTGCVFSTRCPRATENCKVTVPELKTVGSGHQAACLLL